MPENDSREVTSSVPTITRHEVDEAAAEENVELLSAAIRRFVELIPKSPKSLNSVLKRSLDEFGYRCVGDPGAAWIDTWNTLLRAMQSSAAIFVAASTDEGEVEFRIGEDTVRREATGPTMDSNGVTWLNALWLATICRERPRLDLLSAVPVDLLRGSRVQYDEFVYTWASTLQTYWRQGENLVEGVLESMRGTDPAGLAHLSEEMVLEIYYPPIELFYHLTQREDAKFNETLAEALELHKRFWTKEQERVNDPNGFVALGPLAVACLARDAGVAIEVESEYLPKHLLEGTWVGEHST
ncbi:immunity 49 family protein [Amycolatopsis sp. H20-H5]|uniref:immunity 49 family protein n=1 Tax=Amycolatopsis sp. H20-H5 TaxID=3046309 RepID=UPI002DB872F2|nr:immunity 49 family protein [Amycolatopsis sp. H20-H5]MEC3979849.1 immunity 49 family protein [Amycolatopsis sp. H20-H5]